MAKRVKRGRYRPLSKDPELAALIRHDYEVEGLSARALERRHKRPRCSIDRLIRQGRWVRLGGDPGIRLPPVLVDPDLATELMSEALRPALRSGQDADELPETARSEEVTEAIEATANAGSKNPSDKGLGRPQIGSGEQKNAQIIDFPGAKAPPKPELKTVQVLPGPTAEDRSKLRGTLAAIRAMMTVEQVFALEHHEGLLRRYGHLIEVYLEPQRFVERGKMNEVEYGEAVTAVHKQALSMLLPTARDTLAGAIKTLNEALQRTMELKRRVAGLQQVGRLVGIAPDPIDPEREPSRAEEREKRLAVENMTVPQLRHLHQAMEILERHQHRHSEAPKPPPPDSIDDLFDAPPVIGSGRIEPEQPEVPR